MRQWLQRWSFLRPGNRRPARRAGRRLILEELEPRTVPALFTWTQAVSGDWDNPNNWSHGVISPLPGVPGAADDAVISFSGITVTHNTNVTDAVNSVSSAADFNFSAGSLSVASSASFAGNAVISGGTLSIGTTGLFTGPFGQSGGTLTGNGSITMQGLTSWTGGTMSGNGPTFFQGTFFDILGTTDTLDTRVLHNTGFVTQTGTLTAINGAVINNDTGANWLIPVAENINSDTLGTSVFNNLGNFQHSAAAGTESNINLLFNSSGTIKVVSGILNFTAGGNDTGNDSIAAGATLMFSGGTYNFQGSSTSGSGLGFGSVGVTGLPFQAAASTPDITGPGDFVVTNGTVNVAGGFTVTGNVAVLGGGTANFTSTVNNTGSVTFTSLNIGFGTLTGSASITVTGATTWDTGRISGTGVISLLGNSSFFASGSLTDALDTATLNNFGTVTDSVPMPLTNGATVDNDPGATWNLQNGASVTGSGLFTNLGTLNSAPGAAGSDAITARFTNVGTFNVQSGVFNATAVTNSGTVNIAANSTISLGTGSSSPSTGAGPFLTIDDTAGAIGTVDVSTGKVQIIGEAGVVLSDIAYDSLGDLFGIDGSHLYSINTGTGLATLIGPTNLPNDPGLTALTFGSNGTLYATSASTQNLYTLDPKTGAATLVGNVGFTSAGDLAFNGGDLFETASTAARNSELIRIHLSTPTTIGSVTDVGSTGFPSVFGLATGGNGVLYGVSGTQVFSINTSTGAGTLVTNYGGQGLAAAFGTAFVTEAGAPQPGTFTQTAGLLAGGGVIVGNVIINGGVVSPGFSPGTLTVNGNYTQGSGGSLKEEIAGTGAGQFDVLNVTGTASLGGTLNISLLNGFVPAPGSSFNFLTAASISGTFATVNGLAINGSESFTLTYGAQTVTLNAIAQAARGPDKFGVVRTAADGTATWITDNNGDGKFDSGDATFTFGVSTDLFLVGDWAGLGFESGGAARPGPGGTMQFSLDYNGDNAFDAGDRVFTFGLMTDTVVLGDWNGDGKTKVGVVRAGPGGTAQWFLDSNGDGVFDAGDMTTTFGLSTDGVGAGDWTGTGTDKLIAERPGPNGVAEFFEDTNGDGVWDSGDKSFTFGNNTDSFIVGDWTGDGKTKVAAVRPGPNGTFSISLDTNGDGAFDAGDQVFNFAMTSDTLLVGKWRNPAPVTPTGGAFHAFAGLSAADGRGTAAPPPLALDAVFQSDVNTAIDFWARAGLDPANLARLRALTYGVATLDGDTTAEEGGNRILVDATAAGHGWSEGPAPQPDRIDLETALAHEMGHALGLGHSADPNDVMFESLPTGVRRAPSGNDVNAVLNLAVPTP
jgi:hypothetical protein